MSNPTVAKSLYNALTKKGYTASELGDENTFVSAMDNAENRKELYDIVSSDGYDLGEYDAFEGRFAAQPDVDSVAMAQPATAPVEDAKTDSIKPVQPIQSPNAKIVENTDDYFPKVEQNTREDVARLSKDVDDHLNESVGQSARQYVEQTENAAKGGLWKLIQNAMTNTAGAAASTDMQQQLRQQVVRGGNDRELEREIIDYEAADHALENARRIINEADINAKNGTLAEKAQSTFVGGAARSFGQKLFDVRTWDMGVTNFKDQQAINEALDAAENSTLTESQEALLNAKAQEMAVQAYFGSYVGRGYKAGSVTAESLPFMLEMCINPASTIGKSASSRLARWALKKFGTKTAETVGRVAGRVLGDVAGAATMTATTGSIRTAADALGRMSGGVAFDTDEKGHVVFDGRYETPEDVGKAIGKAFGATTIENFSEMLGSYFAPMLGVVGKGTRNILDKITAGRVGQFLDDVAASDFAKAVSAFERSAQWSGNLGEFAEELAGGTLNAIIVGDQTLDSDPETGVVNRDNIIDTFLGVTLLGGSLSMLKTAGYGVEKYQQKRAVKRADVAAVNAFGSVDAWDKIKTEVDSASNEELPVVLGRIMSDESVTDDQKTALMVYVGAKQREKGAVIADQKRRENPETPQEQVEVEQSFDNGYALETPQEKNDAQNMLEYQQQQVRQLFGLGEDGDVDAFLGDDPISAVRQYSNDDQALGQAILDYFNAKATVDGAVQKVSDVIEDRMAEAEGVITARVNKTDGQIHPIELNNGKRGYVVSGAIVMTDDGAAVNRAKSSESIIVRDAETGKLDFSTPAAIVMAEPILDPATEIATMREQISNEAAQKLADEMNGTLAFALGDNYTLVDDSGVQHNAQVVADNGDGTVAIIYDNEQEPTIATKAMVQEMSDTYNQLRLGKYLQDKKSQEITIAEQEAQAEQTEVVAEEQPQVVSAIERIPISENGEQMFEQAPVQDTWAALVELNDGDSAEAIDTAQQMLDNAKKDLAKAQKQKPKVGTTVAEIQANKAEYKAKVSALQTKADYWAQVVGFEAEQKRIAANLAKVQRQEQARQAARVLDKRGRYSKELAQLGEYLDFEDFVMRAIVSGGIKFKWSDNSNGTKGLGSHLGLKGSQSERARRIWLLDNVEGEYPETAAERLVTAYNEEMGYEDAARMDTMSAMGTIINVLSTYDTPSVLLKAIQGRHNPKQEEFSEEEIQYFQSMREAEAMGMTPEDWLMYQEMMQEITLPALAEVSNDELNTIFVELYQQQDDRSRENTPIQQGVSEGQERTARDAGGNGVLSEQQPDNTTADRRGDGRPQQDDVAGQQGTVDVPAQEVSRESERDARIKEVKQENLQEEQKSLADSKEVEQVTQDATEQYTITPAQYTNKKGKVLDMHLVKFADNLTKEQQRAAKQFAKENGGWWDKDKGGFMMRSEESAKELADNILNNAEAVSDAQLVSLEQMREVGSATNDVVETQPAPQSNEPKWKYELTVYENGRTVLDRSQIMPNGIPVYDGHFEVTADSPRDMLGILSNPGNGLEGALEQIGAKLNERADVFDFRKQAETEGVNGFKIGDRVAYTYNNRREEGTIYDFNDYGDHAPVLDLGLSPVMYVQAQWDQIEKIDNSENVLNKEPQTNPSGNKLVTDEEYEDIKRRLRLKMMGQMNMGIDPEILALGTRATVYHIEKGARKFADYAKGMIADLGDMIRPYLKAFYNGARDLPEVENEGFANDMTPYDEVRTFDVANFDKTTPDAMIAAETVVKEQEVEQQAEVATEKIKNNRNKARKSAKKSVTSQEQTGGLFDDLFAETNKADAELHRQFAMTVKADMLAALDNGTKPYRSILDLRKRASELGMEVDSDGRTDILLQELVEDGLVRAAREVIGRKGRNSRASYDLICKLYEMQPTIAARSSNRIKMQQYSTPLPMAFVADMFAISPSTRKVLEPTAGNGMMVFAVSREKIYANELDETRIANLRDQGFASVTQQDAMLPFDGEYDAVIANPPFGDAPAKDYDGKSISGLDPQIVLNSLAVMQDNGKAAIIIGGNMEYAPNGSIKNKKSFFTYLYDHYNVKGVIDMSGGLYAKQGTTFPTRMILIDGRRSEEERTQTAVYPPIRDNAIAKVETFEQLYETVVNLLSNKQKTNGTEVLRSQAGRPMLIADNASGETDGNGYNRQSRSNDRAGRRTERRGGAGLEASAQSSQRSVLGERGSNDTVSPASRGTDTIGEPTNVGGGSEQRAVVDGTQRMVGVEVRRSDIRLTQETKKRELSEEKLPYRPHNTAFSLESVAPAAMVEAMDNVLSQIEEKHGNIDEFVRKELGYDTIEDAHNALAAEQMDSVAMAIYQMKQGQAMIIGDQTGVGKGRQMAALIRWAVRRGEKPIFITQKADLFSDIYRDLVDIGSGDLVPFIFNSPSGKENKGEIVDSSGNVVYKGLSDAKMKKVLASGELSDSYDFAVLTYSQVNTGDDISQKEADELAKKNGTRTKKSKSAKTGKATPKATFLRAIAADNYLFLDESHTAAGSSNTGAYLQSILRGAKAATFASATFAKRPDTMPLYAIRTAMSQAKVEPDKMIAIIEKGGVTLQEIMSRELTNAGQMVRRERDMSDVVTDWKTITDPKTVERARANYDRTITAFNAIIKFQEDYVKPMIESLSAELAIMAESASVKKGTNKMGVENVPFASKAYNYTKQLMLALKVDAIADEVAAEINAGRHPVIALESTMESSIKDYAVGEVIQEPTFSASLLRGLDTVMQYTVKDEDGNERHAHFSPQQLGAAGEKAYYDLQEFIRDSTSDIFISPLDAIIERLHEKGYKVGELTGRNLYVERKDDGRVVVKRRTDKDKKRMQREFNNGELDVLILNKSASTGISLHASEKFSDQRQRTMIIAQPLSDINDYMQMIGRIDRTGQVHRGYYINLGLPVPAENRFLMMLSTKLKSLNANTTTSQDSESNDVEAPDLLNKYGSQVVIEYLRDNPEVYEKMGAPLKDGKGEVKASDLDEYKPQEDDARKVTGYVALLSTKEQEEFYDDVAKRYTELIKYLNDTGSNDLKITVMPLRAKTIEKRVSSEGIDPNGNNPFARNSYVEQVEMDVLRKPMKAEEIRKTINQINGEHPEIHIQNIVETIRKEDEDRVAAEEKRYERAKAKAVEDIAKQADKINAQKKRTEEEKREAIDIYTDETNEKVEEKHRNNLDRIAKNQEQLLRRLRMFSVSSSYLVPDNLETKLFDFASPAIFCGYKTKEKKITASTTLAVFATLDGRRRIEVKLSQIDALLSISKMTNMNWDRARSTTLENWDSAIPTETRKLGYIMTGNILQAIADTQDEMGGYPGQLISYTDIDGNIHDGILMPDKWNASMLKTSGAPLIARLQQIKEFKPVTSHDGKVEIVGSKWANEYYLTVPKTKKDGAVYFENPTLLKSIYGGNFYPYRGKLRADISADRIEDVVKELTKLGVKVKEDTDDGVRYRSDVDEVFDADFAELESEYQQLDKNDEQAMAEWRAKKKRVVESYLNYMTDEYALPCSVFVFDHNDEESLQQAFEVYINTLASKSLFWKTLRKFARQWTYDNFKSKFVGTSTRGARIKGYKASIYDIGNGVDLNKKEDWLNALLHENTHYVVEMLGISDVDNSKLWEEFAHNGKLATVARYVRNYNTTERRVSELLAYSVGDFIKPERVELFDSFMNGDATVEDILKFYNESLPLRNDYVRTILNELKNGRKVREEINRTSRQRRSQSGREIVADRISQERDSQKSRLGRISNERDGRSRRDLTTISEAAEELAKQLNQPIRIIGDVSEINDDDLNTRRRKRSYKGWYDVSTGEIVVVAPNATSVADVQRTVIHEVVAHNGLRELFGADFNTFLDNVYRNVDEPIRRVIANLAARKGWDFRVATEEYLASLAETTNFEEIEKQGWWQKIKDYFMDLLRKVGIKLAKPLTNDELRYILWRSYQMQKSKGAMAVAEDVDMQRKLGVGNFRTRQAAARLAENDRKYMDAVERGDMETAQRMVDEAAKAAGYTEKVYHGTPHFGFTKFDTQRSSGVIFTTNKRNVAANYAGDNNYASVRKVNKGYKEPKSISDIIENARSVFNQDWRLVTPTERETVINKVEAEAQRVQQKMIALETDVPTEIHDNVAWVENIIHSAADGRENGNEGDEMLRILFDDYERFEENRNALRDWISEHRPELTVQQQQYLDYLIGYELGDAAIDAKFSLANAFGSEVLATVDGQSFTPISDLAAITGKAANIGAYELYGNLGYNQLVVNGEGHAWFNLRFNGMRSTDDIAKWAKQNGYTSVVFKNISDYGDPSDVKVFFNPEQVKSADPVTYDDNGNVIPLSQRFNSREGDIRFRSAGVDAPRLTKYNTEKIFGGIWIEDKQEFAKFASAVNNYAFEEDGEGIAYTDNCFYAYYINADGQVIPFASVNLNAEESQEVVNQVNKHLKDVRQGERVKFYFDRAIARARNVKSKNNVNNGDHNSLSSSPNNVRLGGGLLRRGRYYDRPDLFVKAKRADRFGLTDNIRAREGSGSFVKPNAGVARDIYNEKVRTPKTDTKRWSKEYWSVNTVHRLHEAYIDSMAGLKTLQEAILKETGNEIHSFENAYEAENRMSSSNKAQAEIYMRDFFQPLMDEVGKLAAEGATLDDIKMYLIAKHGLERNVVFANRNAQREVDERVKILEKILLRSGLTARQIKSLNKRINIVKAMYDGIKKNLSPVDAAKWWNSRINTLNTLLSNGKITPEQYDKRRARLDTIYNEGFVGVHTRDYSGLTDLTGEDKDFQAAAQHLVQDFEAGYNTKPLWDKINAATKESLRINFESGLMSKETYDKVRTMFTYYVPLRGWDRNVAADEYEYLTSNRPMLSPTLKTAKGRKSLADDPLATIGYMAESAIIQGNRNLMKQKFLNFVQNNPTSLATVSEQWYVRSGDEWVPSTPDIPADATADEVDAIVKAHEQKMEALEDDATKKRKGLKIGLHTTAREGQEHVIRVKRAGKEYCIYINGNPIAAQAINGLTNPNTDPNAFEEVAQALKNLMARAFTSQNPAFIFTNLSRDVIWAGTAVAVKEDKDYAAQYAKNVSKILGTFKIPVLLRKFQNGTLDMNNDIERYFAEFIRNGGETGFTQINTVEDYKRDIERMVKDAKGETSKLRKAWQATWGGIEFLNRSAEDITRFSVYMTSRQMGRDVARSVWDAKEITVNFNKKGRGTFGASMMNFAYIFFNASIQGLANFGRLMYRHPKKMMLALSTFASAGMIAPMFSILLSALLGDDDDNYWDLPEWVRRNNIVLFNPFSERGFFTIPLPHELRPFYGMGELFISVMMGKESVEDALGKAARSFADLLPIDVTGNGGNMAINLAPTVAQPVAQLIANTDYFGVPIYRRNDYNELDPDWTKAYKGTNPFLVESAKWLNEVTGGDNVVKGKVDINPAIVEHLFESYLGGMGKTFNKTVTTFSMLFNKDAREWRNVPVLSSFYQAPNDRTSGSQINREYFEASDEADKIAHQFSGYKKQLRMGAMEYAEKLDELMKSPVFARYQVVNGYNKAITKLNTALKQTTDPTDREQIETAIMEMKAEMLAELEKLDAQTDEDAGK